MSLEQRFWARVEKTDECWLWLGGGCGNGYGHFRGGEVGIDGRRRYVLSHRWAYEQAVGPIGDGLEIDHLCRTKTCVNPGHLEAVTHEVNIRRRPYTRLTPELVRNIREDDRSQSEIARQHGVDPSNISRIRSGAYWASVT